MTGHAVARIGPRRWVRRTEVPCRCQLGCPDVATTVGYDRLMNVVPVAKGHGRERNGS